jgi:hypothetical protein
VSTFHFGSFEGTRRPKPLRQKSLSSLASKQARESSGIEARFAARNKANKKVYFDWQRKDNLRTQ